MFFSPIPQPSTQDEIAIVKAFFDDGQELTDAEDFRSFLEFYREEIRESDLGVLPAPSSSPVIAIRSHQDIIHIVGILRANQTKPRAHVRRLLNGNQCRFHSVKNDEIDVAIDLTLRLWMMLNVRSPKQKIKTPSTPSIEWDDTKTLQEFVTGQFPKGKLDLEPKDSRLSHLFTANFMAKVCGLKVEFTPRLENHLSLIRKDKKLLVYRFKECLIGHLHK